MNNQDIELNQMADDTIAQMQGLDLKDIEKLVRQLPDQVAKLVLIKIIRQSS